MGGGVPRLGKARKASKGSKEGKQGKQASKEASKPSKQACMLRVRLRLRLRLKLRYPFVAMMKFLVPWVMHRCSAAGYGAEYGGAECGGAEYGVQTDRNRTPEGIWKKE